MLSQMVKSHILQCVVRQEALFSFYTAHKKKQQKKQKQKQKQTKEQYGILSSHNIV